jgi:chromosomal replication initiation ATPase DnaA
MKKEQLKKKKEQLKEKINYLLNAEFISEKSIVECVRDYKYECEQPSIDQLYEMRVKDMMNISDVNLACKSQKPEIATARWIMYIYYKTFDLSLTSIANKFNQNHATVSYGIRKFKEFYKVGDKNLMYYLNRDKNILNDSMMKIINS